jgi:hypothetical protein
VATYYIDFNNSEGTSSDSNDGISTSKAWIHAPGDTNATGTPAGITILAGDDLNFKKGISYLGSITVDNNRYNNGTSGNLIRFKTAGSWGSGEAALDGEATAAAGAGNHNYGFYVNARNYIRIDGLTIKNMEIGAIGSGIMTESSSRYCEFVNLLIHDIYGSNGPANGYGIELAGNGTGGDHLIEKNVIYNCEEKCLETYDSDTNIIRYNYFGAANHHCVVLSSENNVVYNNIMHNAGDNWWPLQSPQDPAYGIKCDSGASIFADGNTIYNNLVWDCENGIGILNGQNNLVYHNSVYYIGYQQATPQGGEAGAAFTILDDGTAGSHYCSGNTIRNNIFYYTKLYDSGTRDNVLFYETSNLGNNNTISDNCIYSTGLSAGPTVRHDGSYYWETIATFEGASGFSNYGSGNVAANNVSIEPNFNGGTGASLLTNCPDRFTAAWIPDTNGFELTENTPIAVRSSADLGATYNTDIVGESRDQDSMGAYEFISQTVGINVMVLG